MLRLFADECIHEDLIAAIRAMGIEISDVRQAGLAGSGDEIIFDYAVEHGLTLLTTDRGFGDIFRFDISKSAGVIIILIGRMNKEEIIAVTCGFLDTVREQVLDGKLAIVGKSKIRISER